MMKQASGYAPGNRYDEPMVVHDMSAHEERPGRPSPLLLVARLHVDLCRLAGDLCARPPRPAAVHA
jgi:hypothetical protein